MDSSQDLIVTILTPESGDLPKWNGMKCSLYLCVSPDVPDSEPGSLPKHGSSASLMSLGKEATSSMLSSGKSLKHSAI